MVNAQSFGIQAKVEPEVDKSSQSRMMRDLEKDIEDLEELSFESNGIESKTTPGGGKGGGMAAGAAGGTMTRGGGGLLGGAVGGSVMAGAAAIGAVSLTGVLANKIHQTLSEASGRLQAVSSIWGQASKLFLKPFGDKLGDALLPFAKKGYDMAQKFNEIASEDSLGVAIESLASDVESSLGLDDPSITIPTPEDVFGFMDEFEWSDWIDVIKWSSWINPLSWSVWVGNLLWKTWVNSLTWDNFLNVLKWLNWLTPLEWGAWIDILDEWGPWIDDLVWSPFVDSLTWGNWIDAVSSTSILNLLFGDVSISKNDILGAFGVPGFDEPGNGGDGNGGDGNGGGYIPPSKTVLEETSDKKLYDAADEMTSGSSGDTNVKVEMDGRRLSDGVIRQKNTYDSRIR